MYIRRLREKIDADFEPKLPHCSRRELYAKNGTVATIRTPPQPVVFTVVAMCVIARASHRQLAMNWSWKNPSCQEPAPK